MGGIKVRIRQADPPYFTALQFVGAPKDFDKLSEFIKAIPGSRWLPQAKMRALPIEMVDVVKDFAVKNCGAEVEDARSDGGLEAAAAYLPELQPEFSRLHDYQQAAVRRALTAPLHRWVFADETGLGKSPQAIIAARAVRPRTVLIATTALARDLVWRDELNKWWPDHPHVETINYTRNRKSLSKTELKRNLVAYAAPIQIVSWALLDEITTCPWDVIIFDEVHSAQHTDSGYYEAAFKLTEANPKAAIFGLSATIAPHKPKDVYGPLSVIWPHRFGKLILNRSYSYEFNKRYIEELQTEAGYRAWGELREEYSGELANRVGSVSSRTTKKEVAHLLPAADVRVLRINKVHRAPREPGDAPDVHEVLETEATTKAKHVLNWVEDALGNSSHVAVLTSFRKSARDLAAEIAKLKAAKGVPITIITGDKNTQQRAKEILALKAQPRGILVATFHSVGISIDLTFCARALFAELYDRYERIVQALGRFSRLSGTVPSLCDFLVIEGTRDEKVAFHLKKGAEQINTVFKAGAADEALAMFGKAANDIDAELAALNIDVDLEHFDFDSDDAEAA